MTTQQMIDAADGQGSKTFTHGKVEVRLVKVGICRERADFYLNGKRTSRSAVDSAMYRLQA